MVGIESRSVMWAATRCGTLSITTAKQPACSTGEGVVQHVPGRLGGASLDAEAAQAFWLWA